MFFECVDLQTRLKAIINQKHQVQFKHIISDLKINPNTPQECFEHLSIFEKVLATPKSIEFINLCISCGSTFFKKNDANLFPLHYAVSSLCAENVKSLLASASSAESLYSDHRKILFSNIVNEKFAHGNNYLHNLVSTTNEKNFRDVSEIIKIFVINGCSMNSPNDKLETPFYLLLKKLQTMSVDNDLIRHVLNCQEIDFSSFKSEEIIEMMKEQSLDQKIGSNQMVANDFDYMLRLLKHRNEKKFIDEFLSFRKGMQSVVLLECTLAKFLKISTAMNLCEVIAVLIKQGADINTSVNGSRPPAFTACRFGHFSALEIFLENELLEFRCEAIKRNLLHQTCMNEDIHELDRHRCFSLIVSDFRCTTEIINGQDSDGKSPAYYAFKNGLHDIATGLLKRGAFIGHHSVVAKMDKEIFEKFLDGCIRPSADLSKTDCEIHVDYRFLMPPKSDKNIKCEAESLQKIAESEELHELLLHPVVSSFLQLKWRTINLIAVFNVFLYLGFMLYLGNFILNYFDSTEFKNSIRKVELNNQKLQCNRSVHLEYLRQRFSQSVTNLSQTITTTKKVIRYPTLPYARKKRWLRGMGAPVEYDYVETTETIFTILSEEDLIPFRICVVGSFLIAFYEIFQFMLSPRKYLFKFSNWLDIGLIYLSWSVLLVTPYCMGADTFKTYKAMTILVMSAQTVQSIAKVSIFSMSIHMTIFKKVFVTFLKTISLYMLPILAFAMSFYTLNDDQRPMTDGDNLLVAVNSTKESDNQPFSDIYMSIITTVRMMLSDFGGFTVKKENIFQNSIFLLFIVLVTVVLFNLLNALAISDTEKIMKEAQLVDIKKRVSLLYSYEKLFKFFGITFANVFPQLKTFVLTPHEDKRIKKRSSALLKLVMLLNPLQQTSAYYSAYDATKNKMIRETRSKNSGYTMRKTDVDQIVHFVKTTYQ